MIPSSRIETRWLMVGGVTLCLATVGLTAGLGLSPRGKQTAVQPEGDITRLLVHSIRTPGWAWSPWFGPMSTREL
jgi:hypothetical protein